MPFTPVTLDLAIPGGDRGQWGYKTNAALETLAGGVNQIPEVVGEEVDLQLDARGIIPVVDLVTALKSTPILVSHRGGARIHPEHTIEGYRDSVDSGFLLEADVRKLATGELVCIHDATTTRTMTGATATVSAMTYSDWKSRQVLSPWAGGTNAAPALWEDVLNQFGGRTVIVAEIKDTAADQDIIDSVTSRGLSRQVILQSFDLTIASNVAASGVAAMFLCGSTTSVTPTQLVNAGIEFLGPSKGMSSEDISSFQAAGIKVVPYTVQTMVEWADLQTKGADGAFFDDPWGATGYFARSTRDPFTKSRPWYGWQFYDSVGTTGRELPIGLRGPQGGLFMNGMHSNGSKVMSQPWAEKITVVSGSVALRFRATLSFDSGGGPNTGTATRWMGLFVGNTPNDQVFQDASGVTGQTGYHFLFRRNGVLDIYRCDSGLAATNIASLDTDPALSELDRVLNTEVEIIINGSGLRMRRLDTGGTVNVTDNNYRNNLALHLSCNGTNGEWRNVSYAAIDPALIGY